VISQDADILISATGVPSLVKENWVKKGALVLDVGISFPDGKTPTGDVDQIRAQKSRSYNAYSRRNRPSHCLDDHD
jgi:methylenetetrahydrofolate dehydrogenase (NADP+)/methenyltetrahydrofolate cyclohydrolase